MKVSLIRCDQDGNPVQSISDMAEELAANCQATADLYRRVGYEEQGRGYASQTAAGLVGIARAHDPNISLKAFTLKEENPSTRILRRLGFSFIGIAQDADAGEVWEWRG